MASENRQKKTFKYLCEHCGYKTNRKWSFDYHLSRKNPCKPIEIESTVSKDEQNVNPVLKNEKNEQNVNPFERNSFKFEQNINPSNQNYSCDMCKKVFTFKSSLKRHMKTCKGTHDPLQCPICKVVSRIGHRVRQLSSFFQGVPESWGDLGRCARRGAVHGARGRTMSEDECLSGVLSRSGGD
tara:strand:- start:29 stop:577 length:549 start_codon:yes stop_codon:yes gene_type:complete